MNIIHMANTVNVKLLREKLGISQQELAAKTGIPKDRIAKWEQGKGRPKSEDTAILLSLVEEDVPHGTSKESQKTLQALMDKIAAQEDLLFIFLDEISALRSSAFGTHPEVERKRLLKAAEDYAKLRHGKA